MDLDVGDAEVDTGAMAAGVALGVDLVGSATMALDLGPGKDLGRGLPLDDRGGYLLATGRAIVGCTGLCRRWKVVSVTPGWDLGG